MRLIMTKMFARRRRGSHEGLLQRVFQWAPTFQMSWIYLFAPMCTPCLRAETSISVREYLSTFRRLIGAMPGCNQEPGQARWGG